MVEVAEDNKKKEQRREKGKEMQKRRRKSPDVEIEPRPPIFCSTCHYH